LEAGRIQHDRTVRGPLPELTALVERLARELAPASGSGPIANTERPPVAAFENYIKGVLAETPATAVIYLNTALMIHPGYDRARLALWDVYAEQDDHARALGAVQAVPPGSPF